MSDETPEIEPSEEAPKKPRRRRKKAETSVPSEGPRSGSGTDQEAAATRGPSDGDDAPAPLVDDDAAPLAADEPAPLVTEPPAEEVEPEPVAEGEPEAEVSDTLEAEAPKRARRRRRGGAAEEEAPVVAAPTRRRRAERDPSLPPPVVRAQAKYVRSSARKARLVCDHIRGKSVEDARAILAHTPRAIARDWSKLLESAVANAEHNHELVGEDLYVKAVHADEGPTIRRFRPRAMGRATKIRKRTSHLTILLTPKE
jgi:ribosomal protein L22